MDDPKWLRLLTIGLVLAAIAVGYILITGGFFPKTKTADSKVGQVNGVVATATPTPTPLPVISLQTATPSAYTQSAARAQGASGSLPNTGFPMGFLITLTTGVMIAGLGLRKFPH